MKMHEKSHNTKIILKVTRRHQNTSLAYMDNQESKIHGQQG